MTDPLFITKPHLPNRDVLSGYLDMIWKNKILTNNGPLVQELEIRLAELLDTQPILLYNSATSGLCASLQALNKRGSVITTPFTFVSTITSIIQTGNLPIFADINPSSFNLEPSCVRDLITSDTVAIMPVHTYGIPCDMHAFDEISKEYNIPIIYDAAHCFGVKCDCGSILSHGDISVVSLHATKVFNTFEGGLIVANNSKFYHKLDAIRNFGYTDHQTIKYPGLNYKMSELHAAVGLSSLPDIPYLLNKRKQIYDIYLQYFKDLDYIEIREYDHLLAWNFSYAPILVSTAFPNLRNKIIAKLNSLNIFPRAYFSPLCSFLPFINPSESILSPIPNAESISERILCLPISSYMDAGDAVYICQAINSIR